ncbi:DNA repair exonuclease [Vagococcus sp. CY52-2]|uniref:metallophosphoesterase family protein n=1 Tax=Vagococcus sp. CY52-2 TaxID=2925838 RepID=UPI001F57FD0B|nr:DNA repair exonuclease [Vagococcus sp. CY52-2]UNM89645.1 DNA repair exonuclease [Vagococcus sp. CY52-2]
MKFIHMADLHIDQPFSGITTEDVTFQKEIQQINYKVFETIIENCIKESVDFLLIVGDTFHQATSSIYTQKFVMDQFRRLEEEQIKVVMSFGNHDYYTKSRYWFEWPQNVILFDTEEVTTKVLQMTNGQSVSISGFSYEHQWIKGNKALDYPSRSMETDYHIGFYHGEIAQEGKYAPFLLSDLKPTYDYWALGHIHKTEVLTDKPLTIYPGTPQGHTRKERQTKGVGLVEVNGSSVSQKFIDVSKAAWVQQDISLKEITRSDQLTKIEKEIMAAKYTKEVTLLVVKLSPSSEEGLSELLLNKEEILGYLQRQLLRKTSYYIWLVDIMIEPIEIDQLIMGFDSSLVDDLAQHFLKRNEFNDVAKDIVQQPVIGTNIVFDEEDMERIVEESSQLVKDKMIFKNGVGQ